MRKDLKMNLEMSNKRKLSPINSLNMKLVLLIQGVLFSIVNPVFAQNVKFKSELDSTNILVMNIKVNDSSFRVNNGVLNAKFGESYFYFNPSYERGNFRCPSHDSIVYLMPIGKEIGEVLVKPIDVIKLYNGILAKYYKFEGDENYKVKYNYTSKWYIQDSSMQKIDSSLYLVDANFLMCINFKEHNSFDLISSYYNSEEFLLHRNKGQGIRKQRFLINTDLDLFFNREKRLKKLDRDQKMKLFSINDSLSKIAFVDYTNAYNLSFNPKNLMLVDFEIMRTRTNSDYYYTKIYFSKGKPKSYYNEMLVTLSHVQCMFERAITLDFIPVKDTLSINAVSFSNMVEIIDTIAEPKELVPLEKQYKRRVPKTGL